MKKLIDSLYNINILLTEKFKIPVFSVCADQISVIKSPNEFYEKLKELSSKSKKRINISSLYIGTNLLEKQLIHSFFEAKFRNPGLNINILLDYNRGTRETSTSKINDSISTNSCAVAESSKSILLPLVKQGAEVNFYLTHKLAGWHRHFLRREKFNELVSLHHMKLYIFDDDIIISGANLSDLYFTNRQDRYVLIQNSPLLCDYFEQLIKTISKYSLQLQTNGTFILHDNCRYDPRKYFHGYFFRNDLQKEINKLNNEFQSVNGNFDQTQVDTVIFPLLQMKTIGINDEEEFTTCLLKNLWPNFVLNIATGYFNLITKYRNLIIKCSNYNNKNINQPINILMASEKANGFYNGKGLLRYIPLVYTHNVRQFLKQIINKNSINVFYYNRDNWSFHGKGIWLKNDQHYLTMVGSTNLGYRSVFRDNEAQIIIVSNNKLLQEKFDIEYNNLVKHSMAINQQTALPEIPLFVSIVAKLFRSLF